MLQNKTKFLPQLKIREFHLMIPFQLLIHNNAAPILDLMKIYRTFLEYFDGAWVKFNDNFPLKIDEKRSPLK